MTKETEEGIGYQTNEMLDAEHKVATQEKREQMLENVVIAVEDRKRDKHREHRMGQVLDEATIPLQYAIHRLEWKLLDDIRLFESCLDSTSQRQIYNCTSELHKKVFDSAIDALQKIPEIEQLKDFESDYHKIEVGND